MTIQNIDIQRVKALPVQPAANTMYYVKPDGQNFVQQFLSNNSGTITAEVVGSEGPAGPASVVTENGSNGGFNVGGALTENGSRVWHADNGGSGSGLDADLLDGFHASKFIQVGGSSPQFRAIKSTHTTTSETLIFDSVIFNNGSHYNQSTGRFTAPVDGLYFFGFMTLYFNPNTGLSSAQLHKNGGLYDNNFGYCNSIDAAYISMSASGLMQMLAGDYATVVFAESGPNMHSGFTKFSGALIG